MHHGGPRAFPSSYNHVRKKKKQITPNEKPDSSNSNGLLRHSDQLPDGAPFKRPPAAEPATVPSLLLVATCRFPAPSPAVGLETEALGGRGDEDDARINGLRLRSEEGAAVADVFAASSTPLPPDGRRLAPALAAAAADTFVRGGLTDKRWPLPRRALPRRPFEPPLLSLAWEAPEVDAVEPRRERALAGVPAAADLSLPRGGVGIATRSSS